MPQTFNGIGTCYYGKKNKHVREDTCEHCGNAATLTSYDTTSFVVLLYIPIVPLGRYRVVDECSACTKHYAVPLKDWNAQKQSEVGEAAAALERDPWNAETAMELVRTCAGYHDRESLARHEASIDQALSNDAAGQAFLASAYEYFNDPQKAEAAYRKALMVRDDPTVRHQLGILLINQGRPAEAKDYLWHLLTPDADPASLYFLVEGFQAKGMHREAGEVLNAMARDMGAITNDEIFQKYKKRVRKRTGSTRPLASPLMRGKPLGYDNSRTVLVTVSVIVLLAGVAGFFAYTKAHRADVYLVNGLDRAYSVHIAGETHRLEPLATAEITIPRSAELVATVSEEEVGWPATVSLPIATNFWAALFEKKIYILNPDRTAIIVWEQTEYRVDPFNADNPTRVHLGRGLHTFENIDYVFEEFPEEITLDSGRTTELRTRIWRVFEVEPADAFDAALDEGHRGDGIEYLVAKVRAYPDDEATLALAATVVPDKQFSEIAKPHLAARPLKLDWHRFYQTMLERAGRSDELIETYGALVAAEPDNADLLYLLARVTPDVDLAEARLRTAAEANPPSAYGIHGLAFQRVTEARFEEALALARRARELDPDKTLFTYAETEALMGLRRFDTLIEQAEATLEANPYDGNNVAYAVRLYVATGQRERARRAIDAHVELLEQTDGAAEMWRAYLEGLERLGSGDWDGFLERAAVLTEVPRTLYQAAVAEGDISAAIEALGADASAFDHLVIYIAARRARDREAADTELHAAIDALANGTLAERLAAGCLGGEIPRATMLRVGLQPDAKAVVLAALVVESRQSGDRRLRALGRKLNYGLTFTRYYLDRVVF